MCPVVQTYPDLVKYYQMMLLNNFTDRYLMTCTKNLTGHTICVISDCFENCSSSQGSLMGHLVNNLPVR